MRSNRGSRRAGAVPVTRAAALGVAFAFALAACSDDDGRADDETEAPIEPPAEVTLNPVDEQAVIDTADEIDRTFITEVLADDAVTAEELASAYDRYVECLADGGGFGRYAYDIQLDSRITVDWQLPGDDRLGNASATLDAVCSANYLGELPRRYRADNPPPDDIAAQQRSSVVDCVEAIDPAAANEVPSEITTDTGVEGDAVLIYDVQLDATFLGVSDDEAEEIATCFLTLGATWHDFGEPPDDWRPPTTPAPFVPDTEPVIDTQAPEETGPTDGSEADDTTS